jgi:hypothetical protein
LDDTALEDLDKPPAASDQTGDDKQKLHAAVGFTSHLDLLTHHVHFGDGAGAAGFVGQMSEISWIEWVHRCLVLDFLGQKQPGSSIAAYSYYTDDENVLATDEDHVNALELPSEEVTVILTEAYFHCLQGSFNFVIREHFLQDLAKLRPLPQGLSWDHRQWLGLANVMWAIASKWLQMAGFKDRISVEDHSVYYARARALGFDHRVAIDHPNLKAIQALGLISFYLYINGSINRYLPHP